VDQEIVVIKQSISGSKKVDNRDGPKMKIASMSIIAIV
jgi:hypothetical protein